MLGERVRSDRGSSRAVLSPGPAAHREDGWGQDRLAPCQRQRAASPGAYREGDEGRPVGPGSSPATPADPLLQRQGACRAEGEWKPRQENAWGGQGDLEHLGAEMDSRAPADATRVSTAAAEASVYTEAGL